MTSLSIKKLPDSILRKKTIKVGSVGALEKKILTDMAETMYISQGVGLAATQVGLDRQIAVIDIGNGLIKMINPVIIKKEGSDIQDEGCLSVPGVSVKVKRARKVIVTYMDENGETVQMEAEGLLARAIQHELDHLSGKLIIDYLGPVKKMLIKRRSSKNA